MSAEIVKFKTVEESRREMDLLSLQAHADYLIKMARAYDAVVTIQLKPLKPLMMGNYEMVADVRSRRGTE